jgi:choline dehydrogenase
VRNVDEPEAGRVAAAGFSVLLIEAGTGDIRQPKIVEAPLWMQNIGTDTDWQIPAPAQPALNNRQIVIASLRALGGGGSVNAMFWLRPDVRDLSVLTRLLGPRWSTDNLYAAIGLSERFVTGNSSGRPLDGKMTVGRYAPENPISEASIHAARDVNMPFVDHNASRLINGMGFADVNATPEGMRSGPAQTYIADAITRSNLDVVTDALVTRLLFQGNLCIGIECLVNGKIERFYASRDVVLSAGAFGSPKILMLSGVGRERDLRRLGIEVVHHLPAVGARFQDHVLLVGITYRGGPAYVDQETVGIVATHGFTSTDVANAPPDIQITCMQKPFPPDSIPDGHGFSLLPWVAKPRSRGSIVLRSKDPRVPILADPAYLSDSRDVAVLLKGLELSLAIGAAPALQPFVDRPIFNPDELRTLQQRLQFVRANAQSGFHPVSSCSAGTDPARSVVNSSLKVWGLRNLRVVDASVLPEVPGVNPQVMITGVAELASQIILQSISSAAAFRYRRPARNVRGDSNGATEKG